MAGLVEAQEAHRVARATRVAGEAALAAALEVGKAEREDLAGRCLRRPASTGSLL